ncbi:MAG: ATP-binding protein [Calditrichaeota bacterium]|nr:MAG: ATP-binding protein [Calditrichota bacterium]
MVLTHKSLMNKRKKQARSSEGLTSSADLPQDAVEIHIPSDPKWLKIVRMSVAYLCTLIGFSEDEQRSTVLAVDEACSNIIKHAYEGQSNKPIHVRCRLLDRGIEVVLRDFGRRADLKRIKPRDLDEIRPGGLGVHLIKSVMDEVKYDNTLVHGNQLTLIKFMHRKQEDAC